MDIGTWAAWAAALISLVSLVLTLAKSASDRRAAEASSADAKKASAQAREYREETLHARDRSLEEFQHLAKAASVGGEAALAQSLSDRVVDVLLASAKFKAEIHPYWRKSSGALVVPDGDLWWLSREAEVHRASYELSAAKTAFNMGVLRYSEGAESESRHDLEQASQWADLLATSAMLTYGALVKDDDRLYEEQCAELKSMAKAASLSEELGEPVAELPAQVATAYHERCEKRFAEASERAIGAVSKALYARAGAAGGNLEQKVMPLS